MSSPLPPKKEVALALLERSSVHIHLDPRAPGVVVPAWFKKQPQLVLQVGLNMPVPIPDLRVDEDGISCTLSFNRSPFFCVVPWLSVYALVGDDGRGMVWPDNVPPEVANQATHREGEGAKRPGPKRVPSSIPSARSGAAAPAGPATRDAATDDRDMPPSKGRKPKKRTRTDATRDAAAEATSPARVNLVAVPSGTPAPHAMASVPSSVPSAGPSRETPKKTPQPVLQKALRGTPGQPPSAVPPKAEQASPTPNSFGERQAERRPNAPARPKRELPPYLRVVK